MPNILTPLSVFGNFDASLPTYPTIMSSSQVDDVRIERITFSGRETSCGRVRIAAAFACNVNTPSIGTVLVFPDSSDTIDDEILKFFVSHGYMALMVDYRGEWTNETFVTQYPEDIAYANTLKCGRHKDYVDESADKTSWYEWVGVGIYARKYLTERTGSNNIAAVGIRDGGEIVWKLGVACKFSCIVPVCAAGWKAYAGVSKYTNDDPVLDEERYRFIAGIDSQAYAPHVKCPVLMLCTTNDKRFDYDRAYDTFSRINPDFIGESAIAFTLKNSAQIGPNGIDDMFLMLDKNLKKRQVFIPRSPEITIDVDAQSNLTAKVAYDNNGVLESCKLYLAEDGANSVTREWCACPEKPRTDANAAEYGNVLEYFLNVYEKTAMIFVLCRVKYTNGFTVWSKITAKKISGLFRNTQCKRHVIYNDKDVSEDFFVANSKAVSVGGIFFPYKDAVPRLVQKAQGVKGLYSPYGLSTYRVGNRQFLPSPNSVLSLDVYSDETSAMTLTFSDIATGEEYSYTVRVIGGAWQTVISESSNFKSANGVSMSGFLGEYKFTVSCPVGFAVNNIMWL